MSRAFATEGPVLIWGTGLIGTSVGLALRGAGVEVYLQDTSPMSQSLAADMGAGTPIEEIGNPQPKLVVVAAPPDVAANCVLQALEDYPDAVVTDVASVKTSVENGVEQNATAEQLRRYVGSHPMAGRSRSGASYAVADLFYGQPWVIVPTPGSDPAAVLTVRNMTVDLGAIPLEMDPQDHDEAVAYVSHVPQLVSSLLAARLLEATGGALDLAGQGLRDTTRIAASDPRLWTAIIAGNAEPISRILDDLGDDMANLTDRLRKYTEGQPGAVATISEVMTAGNRGRSRIPGKHGGAQRRWAELEVLVPDQPGELGRLFGDVGSADINIEDLALEHAAGRRFGIATLMIDPADQLAAVEELEARGWRIINGGVTA